MTQALAAAVASTSRFPDEEQDVLASLPMAEMDSEDRWNTLFSQFQGVLADLAQQALLEHLAGETRSLSELE